MDDAELQAIRQQRLAELRKGAGSGGVAFSLAAHSLTSRHQIKSKASSSGKMARSSRLTGRQQRREGGRDAPQHPQPDTAAGCA